MGETVYVDLLFLINFSMDFLCFYITSRILSEKLSTARTLMAAAVGGIYADLALFISMGSIASLIIDLSVCALICCIANYKKGRVRALPLYTLVYLAVSMALGGFMTAIFNMLNKVDIPIEGETSEGISVWLFAVLAGVSALMTLIGGRFFKRRSGEIISEVVVVYSGKTKKLRAMTDTGNLLREPISGKPCLLVDIRALSGVVPERVIQTARGEKGRGLDGLSVNDAKNIRLIPIKTANAESTLIGLRVDKIEIVGERGRREVDAVIALSDIGASANGSEALIPSELLI